MDTAFWAGWPKPSMSGGSASESRRELAQWSDRELHDIGVSSGDAIYEASKPFWRA